MGQRGESRKVLFTALNYSPEDTGIGPYAAGFAQWLNAQPGYEPHILTAHPHYPEWKIRRGFGQWRARTLEAGVSVDRVRHYVPESPGNIRRLIAEVTFALRVVTTRWSRPDLIVTVSPSLFASAAVVMKCLLIRRPVIVWAQDLYSVGLAEQESNKSALVGKVLRKLESLMLRHATLVVAIHDRFADRIVNELAVDRNRIRIIRNWSHIEPGPELDRAGIRQRFGWGDNFVIVHAGAQGNKQGLDTLIPRVDEISSQLPDVRWILVGDGSQREIVERLSENVPSIEVWDPLPRNEFVDLLAGADAFLVCEAEGISESAVPSKLTTYFSAGRPVLGMLNPAGITWSEIEAARAGIQIPHSTYQLRDAVLTLMQNPEASAAMGRNGPSFCQRFLGREAAHSAFEQVVREALEEELFVVSRSENGR